MFLIQSAVAPKLGDDIDSDNNGTIDAEGVAKDWNVYDSLSMHDDVFDGSVAYGKVAFIAKLSNEVQPVATPSDTNVINTKGSGTPPESVTQPGTRTRTGLPVQLAAQKSDKSPTSTGSKMAVSVCRTLTHSQDVNWTI